MSKVKQWIYDIRILPNDKRGLASGAYSSGALALALIVYLIAEALGHTTREMELIIEKALRHKSLRDN